MSTPKKGESLLEKPKVIAITQLEKAVRYVSFGPLGLKKPRVLLVERHSSKDIPEPNFGKYSNWRERGFAVAIQICTYMRGKGFGSGTVYIAAKDAATASSFGEYGLLGARFNTLAPWSIFHGNETEVSMALSVGHAHDILTGSKLATEITEILLKLRAPVVVAPEEYQHSSYRPPELPKRPLAPSENLPNERVSRAQICERLGEMWCSLVLPKDIPPGGITDDTQFAALKMQDSDGPAVAPFMLLLQAMEHCFGIDPARGLFHACEYDMGKTVAQLKNWIYWERNRPMP